MSKKFKFDLQRLLNLRERMEEQKAQELLQARTKESEAEDRLNQLQDEKAALIKSEERKKSRNGIGSIVDFQITSGYMAQLGENIVSGEEQMQKCQEESEDKRQELMKAVQSREAMSNLKDKRRQEFRIEENRRAISEEGEIAIGMFSRKSRSSESQKDLPGDSE